MMPKKQSPWHAKSISRFAMIKRRRMITVELVALWSLVPYLLPLKPPRPTDEQLFGRFRNCRDFISAQLGAGRVPIAHHVNVESLVIDDLLHGCPPVDARFAWHSSGGAQTVTASGTERATSPRSCPSLFEGNNIRSGLRPDV